MQILMSRMRAAMEKYDMIQDGDRLAVGVSGGKDSMALLAALSDMRRFYPQKFELVGLSLDMGFDGNYNSFEIIADFCRSINIEYHIKKTELAKVIFENREEKNPCSLCAKMRRGILHDFAKEYDCNKLALGHHMDDAAETFLMNLLRGGNISCFRPMTYMSRKNIHVIRPMILTREQVIISAVKRANLPIVKSKCPIDGVSERQKTKELLTMLDKDFKPLREKIIGALQRREIDGW